jgi:hypothetical protein
MCVTRLSKIFFFALTLEGVHVEALVPPWDVGSLQLSLDRIPLSVIWRDDPVRLVLRSKFRS